MHYTPIENKPSIRFYPECDDAALVEDALEYQAIFEEGGRALVERLEAATGRTFSEGHINAVVCYRYSNSFPLVVTASRSRDSKITTLAHELCRRLLKDIEGHIEKTSDDPDVDKLFLLYVILYDVFLELYGDDFLARCIARESSEYGKKYEIAWSRVAHLSPDQRQDQYIRLQNACSLAKEGG